MSLPKRYQPEIEEPRLEALWQDEGIYHFQENDPRPVYSIDTPPPTVSGSLHIGHVYSYSQADFMARYFRMRGCNVYYPMGFDDNGLPTDRLVEKRLGIRAEEVGREAYIEKCLQVSEEAEKDYRALWQRLGLSVDWRHTYRTIDARSRRISQLSFIDLYKKDLAYRFSAPAIWCPECHVSIAQADLNDQERQSEFVTLDFRLEDGASLPIATTRPELLAACVAIFVHPDDPRFQGLIGQQAWVPLYSRPVPVLADPQADPNKGTGAVMCCTFGDQADVAWWYTHKLPLIEAIDRVGRMTAVTAGAPGMEMLAGLPVAATRKKIKQILDERGLILGRQPVSQSIRVHERCDTPVEYIVARQWFIKVLDHRQELLDAGEQIRWHPDYMKARYLTWVENLNWDWCISRQRYFGVTFPVWYCKQCGQITLAEESRLPVDPLVDSPSMPCACGSTDFEPETDVMDTWATSSLSPQIVGGWQQDETRYQQVYPFGLRPQAHEIIRTWAFYTILKSLYHFNKLPWRDVLISGWAIAGEGMGKISKSRGGGPMAPLDLVQKYSADALRYWAASTGAGRDSIINEEKFQMGVRFSTKLWNVARFCEPFLAEADGLDPQSPPLLSPADRWILAGLQSLVQRATAMMEDYEFAAARGEIESFFWSDLADNYIEMAKQRLYNPDAPLHGGGVFSLSVVLRQVLKLLAPFMPYVTDAIYRGLFSLSVHTSGWAQVDERFSDADGLAFGERLVEIATAVRRFKSEQNLGLGTELNRVQLALEKGRPADALRASVPDLMSVTRALNIEILEQPSPAMQLLEDDLYIAIQR